MQAGETVIDVWRDPRVRSQCRKVIPIEDSSRIAAEIDKPVPGVAGDGRAAARGGDHDTTESVARRALLFDHMSEGVIITDLDARIVEWNPGAERLFGYTQPEMLGRRVNRLYRVGDPLQLEEVILADLEKRDRWVGELRFVRKDGETGWCETTIVPLRDEHGARIANVCLNRDVTEARRVEAALERSNGILRAVVDETSDAIFVKDALGRYVMMNSAGSRLLGRPVEEIIGRDDTYLFPPDEAAEILEIDRRVMSEGEPHTFEETATFVGAQCRLFTTKAPWRDARNRTIGVVGIARDITRRWEAEDAARRHREELAHVLRVRTIGELAAGLGHEINQPLGAIANYAEGCVRRLRAAGADPDLIAVLDEISAQALRAGSVVRRLGEFVRKQPARRETVELAALVQRAAQLIEREAREEDVAIELLLAPRVLVRVDPVQIEQVVLNVLLNGIEAMRGPGRRLARLSVRSSVVEPGLALVEISDGGPGVRDGDMARIFDPFFTTKANGLGLGLAISRSIIEAHDGSLQCVNAATGGTTFVVRLPLAP